MKTLETPKTHFLGSNIVIWRAHFCVKMIIELVAEFGLIWKMRDDCMYIYISTGVHAAS